MKKITPMALLPWLAQNPQAPMTRIMAAFGVSDPTARAAIKEAGDAIVVSRAPGKGGVLLYSAVVSAPVAANPFAELKPLIDDFTKSLAETLSRQVVLSLREALEAELKNAMVAMPAPNIPVLPTETPAPPFLLGVVGASPQQSGHLVQKFPQVNFRFVSADERHSFDRLKSCEAVFLMAGQVSHKSTEGLKASGIPYTPVNGAVSSLIAAIEKEIS